MRILLVSSLISSKITSLMMVCGVDHLSGLSNKVLYLVQGWQRMKPEASPGSRGIRTVCVNRLTISVLWHSELGVVIEFREEQQLPRMERRKAGKPGGLGASLEWPLLVHTQRSHLAI